METLLPEKLLSDAELAQVSGGLCVHPVGGGFGLGGHFGGGFGFEHFGGGFGSFGFGGPVFVQQPQVVLVPVQQSVDPVSVTGVQTANCQPQLVTLSLL